MGGNIFNGNINGRATAWMMIGMLVFAVAWEAFTDHLDKRFEHNKAHREILGKVYKELMILGFIAFGVIMGKEVGVVTWNAETLHCFEFCDLLVSICVLVYVGNCAISSFTMHTVERDWDRIALMQTPQVIKEIKAYLELLEVSKWEKFKEFFPFVNLTWRRDADFKVMQLLFQTKFHLPLQFDYVMYIKLVLEEVVMNMANVTTYHWLFIMLINFIWWVGMAYGPTPTPVSDKVCMFSCEQADHRRRLGGAAAEPKVCRAQLFEDTCAWGNVTELDDAWLKLRSNESEASYWNQCSECLESLNEGENDISSEATMWSLVLFTAIGWSLVAAQACIVLNIQLRMQKVLAVVGKNRSIEKFHKKDMPELLTSLQESVQEVADINRTRAMDDPLNERTELAANQDLHRMNLVTVDGEKDEEDTDHIMVFANAGKTSNDILSIRDSETLIFLTQLVQLVMDFYFGFYFVHMSQRVPKGFGYESLMDGAAGSQLLVHCAILGSVVSLLLLVMITTRKISILLGVLHLAEQPVSDVLAHMEIVKSLRNRIKDRLQKTALKREKAKPDEAQSLLDKLTTGEKALLERIDDKEWTDRLSRDEIGALFEQHKERLSFGRKKLNLFLDRGAFEVFSLLPAQEQSTVMTAHTLEVADGDEGADTVEVGDFAGWVVRRAAEMLLRCIELSPREGVVREFTVALRRLSIVDDRMIERGMTVGRAKSLFKMADADNGGSISRPELQKMLRRFKVPITKVDFMVIWRVIDPDQSRKLEMDEWLHFMLAADNQLELAAASSVKATQQQNAEKGSGIDTLLGEGTGLFLGETAGNAVSRTIGLFSGGGSKKNRSPTKAGSNNPPLPREREPQGVEATENPVVGGGGGSGEL